MLSINQGRFLLLTFFRQFAVLYLHGQKKDFLLTTLCLKTNDTLRVYKNYPIDRLYPKFPTPKKVSLQNGGFVNRRILR